MLEPGDSFVWSRPELVLAGDYVFRSDPVIRTFDVAPDGRFLVAKRVGSGRQEVVAVVNWGEELAALVPLP